MVLFNDVTLRDGQQSLLGGRMQQKHILELAPGIDASGFNMAEVWGGTCFEMPITYKGEDPWQNLREIRAAMPNTKLSMLLRGQSLVSREIQGDATVNMFVAQAAKNGMNNFRIFDALNDIDNLLPAIRAVKAAKEAGIGRDLTAQGTICYTEEVTLPDGKKIHSIDSMVDFARRLSDAGVDSLCIKDMAGLLTPDTAKELVERLKAEFPNLPLTLHMHSTMGKGHASLKAAIDAGVDIIDTASEGLSESSGHSATETMLDWLQENRPGQAPDIDREQLAKTREQLRDIRPQYSQHETPYRPLLEKRIRAAQVPGGMVTTMQNDILKILGKAATEEIDDGAGKKRLCLDVVIEKTLEEMVTVRADAGYPPLVTPSSQIVMQQSMLNAIKNVQSGKAFSGIERYAPLTEDFAKLVQGRFGHLAGPVLDGLPAMAASGYKPITPLPAGERPADSVAVDLEAKRAELKETLEKKLKEKIKEISEKEIKEPSEEKLRETFEEKIKDVSVDDEALLIYVLYPKAGLEFLLHTFGIEEKTFDAPAEPMPLPEPLMLRGLPRSDVVAPIAMPYIDEIVRLTIQKLRYQSGFILADDETKAAALESIDSQIRAHKHDMLPPIIAQGGFTKHDQVRMLVPEINRVIKARGEKMGVTGENAAHLPEVTLDEFFEAFDQQPKRPNDHTPG